MVVGSAPLKDTRTLRLYLPDIKVGVGSITNSVIVGSCEDVDTMWKCSLGIKHSKFIKARNMIFLF